MISAAGGRRDISSATVFARAGHTLRFYIRPHFGKCHPVTTLKLRFVGATASRPFGVSKTGLMQSGLPRHGSRPAKARPTPAVACSPVGLWRAFRLAREGWSISGFAVLVCRARFARVMAVCPPPAPAGPLRGLGRRAVGPSAPPRGAPSQSRASLASGCAPVFRPCLLAQLPELHTGTLGAPASGEGGAAPIAPPRPPRAGVRGTITHVHVFNGRLGCNFQPRFFFSLYVKLKAD